MPRTSKRLDRISDQLKQELALLIQGELRDPRLGMVSVMDVKVSRDLAHADVFVTVLGAEPREAVVIMNKAAGFLRSLLAKNLNLRVTPRVRFIFDESVERGRHLSTLIDEAIAQDAQHEAVQNEAVQNEAPQNDGDSPAEPAENPAADDNTAS